MSAASAHAKMAAALERRISARLAIAAEQINQTARDAAPVLTGETRANTQAELIGPHTLRVSANTPQAVFTDQGTRPHRIEGNPVLRWFVAGEARFARYVEHPGTTATHWFSNLRPRVVAIIKAAMR